MALTATPQVIKSAPDCRNSSRNASPFVPAPSVGFGPSYLRRDSRLFYLRTLESSRSYARWRNFRAVAALSCQIGARIPITSAACSSPTPSWELPRSVSRYGTR